MAYAAERVLASRRLEALEKELKIPDMTAAAEERYRLKPEEFRLAESVSASHVLVSVNKRSEGEALERAEQVRAKALSGIPFSDLAREYSDDPSAQGNQGNLGFFVRGQMAKPFEDTAFGLEKPGDISAVVKTQFGYHVIRLNEKQSARQRTFDEVREGLISQLTRSYIEKEKQRHAELITTDKSIVMNLEAINTLKKEMPKPTPPTGATAAEK
jgi:peptidyl-prolyl cis-trans isomerase C